MGNRKGWNPKFVFLSCFLLPAVLWLVLAFVFYVACGFNGSFSRMLYIVFTWFIAPAPIAGVFWLCDIEAKNEAPFIAAYAIWYICMLLFKNESERYTYVLIACAIAAVVFLLNKRDRKKFGKK